MDADDLEPRKKTVKQIDLQPLSVKELEDYMVSLEDEIARAEDAIKKKEAHKSGVDALFGSPKS